MNYFFRIINDDVYRISIPKELYIPLTNLIKELNLDKVYETGCDDKQIVICDAFMGNERSMYLAHTHNGSSAVEITESLVEPLKDLLKSLNLEDKVSVTLEIPETEFKPMVSEIFADDSIDTLIS